MDLSAYRFPLFLDLKGKKAVIVGGGKIALRRAGVLLSFGADVTIIAPECEAVPEGSSFLQRPYESGDLTGAFLAVAATNCREVNFQVGQEIDIRIVSLAWQTGKRKVPSFSPPFVPEAVWWPE